MVRSACQDRAVGCTNGNVDTDSEAVDTQGPENVGEEQELECLLKTYVLRRVTREWEVAIHTFSTSTALHHSGFPTQSRISDFQLLGA